MQIARHRKLSLFTPTCACRRALKKSSRLAKFTVAWILSSSSLSTSLGTVRSQPTGARSPPFETHKPGDWTHMIEIKNDTAFRSSAPMIVGSSWESGTSTDNVIGSKAVGPALYDYRAVGNARTSSVYLPYIFALLRSILVPSMES